jgi:hypothetical protein
MGPEFTAQHTSAIYIAAGMTAEAAADVVLTPFEGS